MKGKAANHRHRRLRLLLQRRHNEMIRNTFCILEGIGEKLERRLWQQGILTWEDFMDAGDLLGFSSERKRLFDESLFRFSEALLSGGSSYFSSNIRRREHWRLFDLFRDRAVC